MPDNSVCFVLLCCSLHYDRMQVAYNRNIYDVDAQLSAIALWASTFNCRASTSCIHTYDRISPL